MERIPFITRIFIAALAGILFFVPQVNAQSFSAVNISGFNQDVVAETGTSSLTTTSTTLDAAVPVSSNVMYTLGFAAANGFGGGGLPDNGIITDAAGSYQLMPYNANNALIVQRSQNADLTLNTPATYTKIRVLCFSTEGSSLVSATLFFSDGSNNTYISNYTLGDWFNNTSNLVIQGFGRCKRATPATNANGYPGNPRMYYIEIALNCTDRQKNLQKINFANNTTAGSNAPFPNFVIMAVSGTGYAAPNIVPNISNANCTNSGSAILTITGPNTPYNVSWNTSPVQTGNTANSLSPGNYQASITDGNGCTSVFPVSIVLQNNLTMAAHADTTICSGTSFNTIINTNAGSISWSPTTGVSNPAIANPVLSPNSSTAYTVTGILGTCTTSRSFTVNVIPGVTVDAGNPVGIFIGTSVQLNGSGTTGTYLWSPSTGLSATNILNPVASPQTTITYTLTITTPQGCSGSDTVTVSVESYCVAPMNAFTPNGDGRNDKWLISNGNCVAHASVQVYNRYGSRVYESVDYHNDWQGTYKGKPLPDGTYYYTIHYFLIDGRDVLSQGDVTILR